MEERETSIEKEIESRGERERERLSGEEGEREAEVTREGDSGELAAAGEDTGRGDDRPWDGNQRGRERLHLSLFDWATMPNHIIFNFFF